MPMTDHMERRARDVLLFSFEGGATRESLEASRRANIEVFQEEGGVNFILLMKASAPLPSEEVRAESKKVAQEVRSNLRSQALVILGEGFGAAAHRALISTFLLFQRPGHPSKVFSDVESALDWQEKFWLSASRDHVESAAQELLS